MIIKPIISTNQPNAGFNFLPSTFLANEIPIKIPTTDSAVKDRRKVQS